MPSWDASAKLGSWTSQLAPGFVIFPAAAVALRRFGGIDVVQSGWGVSVARETFTLDPTLALGEEDRFRDYEVLIGQHLYPLGECGNGNYFLAISEDGSVFALMEGIDLVGRSVDEAIENLIAGRRGATLGE
jgi:hypothetical protein